MLRSRPSFLGLRPLFFGSSRRPLYGVYHPARGRARRTAVVLCPPFGQEHLRAHRCLRELATRLAEAGYHTLRFDLQGTGDSAGDLREATLEGWVEDVRAAASEVREASGGQGIALVGLRLGASLAVLAAAHERPDALVLWDVVVEGPPYLTELAESHARWLREHAAGAPVHPDEALGFPLGAALRRSLGDLDLRSLSAPPASRILAVSTDSSEAALPSWSWADLALYERRSHPLAPVWLNAEGMERSLVPVAVLDDIAGWLRETCP